MGTLGKTILIGLGATVVIGGAIFLYHRYGSAYSIWRYRIADK
jgi:hypothetical protein